VVSVTDPYGRILGFLDRSRYFSITAIYWSRLYCLHGEGILLLKLFVQVTSR
jgi:hypothetical protein